VYEKALCIELAERRIPYRAAKGVDSPQPNIFWLIGVHSRSFAANKENIKQAQW